jgi:hypothetical protein
MPHMRRRLEVSQLPMKSKKRVLGELLGVLASPGHSKGKAVDPSLVMADQSDEGAGVSRAGRVEVAMGLQSWVSLGLHGRQLDG